MMSSAVRTEELRFGYGVAAHRMRLAQLGACVSAVAIETSCNLPATSIRGSHLHTPCENWVTTSDACKLLLWWVLRGAPSG